MLAHPEPRLEWQPARQGSVSNPAFRALKRPADFRLERRQALMSEICSLLLSFRFRAKLERLGETGACRFNSL
jgi:hypothetical protein